MKIKLKLQLTFILFIILILSGCVEDSHQSAESTNNIKTLNDSIINYTNETNPINDSNNQVSSIPLEKPPFID